MATTISTEQATDTLRAEGYAAADITAAMDSFIAADAPAEDESGEWAWTAEDLGVLRSQLVGDAADHALISTAHGDARILWDGDHGPQDEGWFLRYSNGRQDNLDEALMSDTLADAMIEAAAFLAREGLA